ncbi:MAG TPA: DUF177 domain-containing protein [Blastocatellia bacterium]|jgi:uncharacterized protein|nr:DUF177 domain-containing protein [Blastocatellia bacterium]
MNINVSQIREAEGLNVRHLYPEGEPELRDEDLRLLGRTSLNLHAARDGDKVEAAGEVRADVELICDRCLARFSLPIEQSFDLLYVPAPSSGRPQEEKELDDRDLSVSVYEAETIDLDDLVREQIELALPMVRLCRESCAGLCPDCRANLNEGPCACSHEQTDSRWDALKSLKSDS